MYILLGLGMGFMGSMHCIGMCGPLVMSIHKSGGTNKPNPLYQFAYHIGKILSYVLIGILFGAMGQTFNLFLSQQKLSIAIGVSFILFFLFGKIKSTSFSSSLTSKILTVTRFFSQLVEGKSILKMFFTGIGNGFLPCGFVYAAAVASIATGKILDSALFMIGFGIGTIPALTSVIYFFRLLPEKAKSLFNGIYNYLLIIVGILLILRGLNLGIPYISPAYDIETEEVHGCCHEVE
jgi:sulfite exporter TauE/SafE